MRFGDLLPVAAVGALVLVLSRIRTGTVPSTPTVPTQEALEGLPGYTETVEHLIETYAPQVQSGALEVRGVSLTGMPLFRPGSWQEVGVVREIGATGTIPLWWDPVGRVYQVGQSMNYSTLLSSLQAREPGRWEMVLW